MALYYAERCPRTEPDHVYTAQTQLLDFDRSPVVSFYPFFYLSIYRTGCIPDSSYPLIHFCGRVSIHLMCTLTNIQVVGSDNPTKDSSPSECGSSSGGLEANAIQHLLKPFPTIRLHDERNIISSLQPHATTAQGWPMYSCEVQRRLYFWKSERNADI